MFSVPSLRFSHYVFLPRTCFQVEEEAREEAIRRVGELQGELERTNERRRINRETAEARLEVLSKAFEQEEEESGTQVFETA